MADDKAPIIVIKKKKGGHAGHHGGAWKVAYADFVTAMMAFFLVMWLLGSDEEIVAAVAYYFNNPTSAYRPDLATKDAVPLGDKTGAGDSLLQGAGGQVPDDMISRPRRPYPPEGASDQGKLVQEAIEGEVGRLDLEDMKFSIPEKYLFATGSDDLLPTAAHQLEKIGKILKNYKGFVKIRGFTDPPPAVPGDFVDSYEFTLTRVAKLSKYFSDNRFANQEQIIPLVTDSKLGRTTAEQAVLEAQQERKIEFILTAKK